MPRRYSPLLVLLTAVATAYAYWEWSRPVDRAPGRRLTAIALSPSGRWIAAASAAGWVSLWDQARPEQLHQVQTPDATPRALAFSPDDRYLLIAHSRGLARHAVMDLEPLRTLRQDVGFRAVQFHRLLGWLAVSDRGTVEQETFSCCATTGSAAFTPDGGFIVTSGEWPAVWLRTGGLVARLTAEREYSDFDAIAFDTRRGWLLLGSRDGRVYAWDLGARELRAKSPEPAGAVESVAALRDSPWIALGKTGAPVHLWNPDTGEMRTMEAIPSTNVLAGSDPGTLIIGNYAGSVQFWDSDSGRMLSQRTLR